MQKEYSLGLITLLKGIVYDHQREVWENVLQFENDIKKYFLVFLPASSDEAKQEEKIITAINKIVEIGFLKKLNDQEYEVHRIIKGFVNADVIDEALKKLQRYAEERKTVD